MKNDPRHDNLEYAVGNGPAVAAEEAEDDERLAAYRWERLGVFCVVGMAFLVLILFAGYTYLHSSLLITPTALR